jgi:hypothetical protein
MRAYTAALNKFGRTHFSDIGASSSGTAAEQAKNAEELSRDLMKISSNDRIYFLICVIMVAILFLGSFFLVLFNLNHPETVKVIFAICGVSFTGLLKQMISLWKEKIHSDMALVLARNLPINELRAFIQILLHGK